MEVFVMNLIANTGIQCHVVPLEINLNDTFKMYFREWTDIEDSQLKLELAHLFSDEDLWVRKRDLSDLGYVKDGKVTDSWENIRGDFDEEGKTPLLTEAEDPLEAGCFQVSLGKMSSGKDKGLEKFENVWLPAPFFLLRSGNKSEFGPTNWCRCKLIPGETAGSAKKYDLLLAFDTRSLYEDDEYEDEDLNETPVFADNTGNPKDYALCNDEYRLIDYCSKAFNCDWVNKYILKLVLGLDNIRKSREQLKLNYLAQYIFLMRYIQRLGVVPNVTLYPNKNVIYGDVDLVVDIGNSRTCAVLFDEGDFEKSSPLELQDFTAPVLNGALNKYRDSFDMRLAFRKADFGGRFGLPTSRQFIYPSMVRLGKEANRLIYKATNINTEAEKKSSFSSPKRFLWDTKLQKQEWEFIQLDGETAKPIYIKGISEQLNSDGSLNTEGEGGLMNQYSRRALMTFAFLEILAQARMQINSYEQRSHWRGGNTSLSKPRRISRIIVTCPAAMSRVEQISLRKCAEDAAIMLERFFKDTYDIEINEKNARAAVQVIPSAMSITGRTDWIYDEATAAQFVFLYAEICSRYKSNAKEYFNVYGKERADDYLGDYKDRSLTVGSVDIGAGTTDVMIAAYKYGGTAGHCTLTPVPLFWESFYEAGDDLLKTLIQLLVIEGDLSPIEGMILESGKNPVELMHKFLGTDNGVSFRGRQLRGDFNLQVSVPVILHFLDLLSKEKESRVLTLSFDDIFGGNPPTQSVLDHFEGHFGFKLESVRWRYDSATVSKIIEQRFEPLIGKIASLFSHYACDIVLLSGRPTSLKPLRDLFTMYYAIAPNRLKTMNDYRVGRWYPQDVRYPFIDEDGKFINPKSIITTGAMIGQKAGNGRLYGFSLNLQELKEKLRSTTNYFGQLDMQLDFAETVITPEKNVATIEIASLGKPVRIGVRQLDLPAYPSRPFYTLGFNDDNIEDCAKGRVDDEEDVEAVRLEVERIKDKIIRSRPLSVTIERDISEDIERLRIDSVVDAEGNDISKNFFCLQVQSMSEIDNFWLDSGLFPLNLNEDKN
jgi:hypothetical protein